ncbi:Secreted RxLR effector peptide protein [Phytophthora palmivora]|uniref:Secreted RxLR effector peptide protein n=1 Tax=Phytophthora palmivora TaxID=4796 RepID=A0A2P4XVL7_9STRA|nr:Secreted RxLR effector peptide protein [Phytophthora palmivora]
MRLVCTIVSAISFLGVDAASIRIDSHQTYFTPANLYTDPHSPLIRTNTALGLTRSLRSTSVANEDEDEERIGISDLSKIAEKLPLDALKLGMNPKDVFTRLHFAEAGVKLDDNLEFIEWLHYISLYKASKGQTAFSDRTLFELLRQSKSEEELVTLFHSLRQIPAMKNIADTMQGMLFDRLPSSHKLMNEVWLKHQETPEEVFKILNPEWTTLDANNAVFLSWLKYTKLYRAKMGTSSFSELQAMQLLLKAKPLRNEVEFGRAFQVIKNDPDLKNLAENMQTHLFQKWIKVNKLDPKEFGDMLDLYVSWRYILKEPKTDVDYQTLEAFTLRYAEDKGGSAVLKEVKALFATSDPEAAVTAAMRVSL